jgi:hypothetical protein
VAAAILGGYEVRPSDRYLKIVEWSDEDQCYIGACPGLMLGGIHGDDETKVYKELCRAVDEWIKINPEIFLARARQLRQKTADHPITDIEFTQAKETGRL